MDDTAFSDFGLSPVIMDGLRALDFTTPTPIQRLAIGPQLAGRDLIGLACTGSGKTAAFALPLLHRLANAPRRREPGSCRALVLVPTRELAMQILTSMRELAGGAGLRACLVVGGAPRRKQVANLARGVDVVVATPGRLIDLMRAGAVRLGSTRHLVIDEADRMLDLGFLAPVRRIAADLAPERQTVMFSATMPAPVAALAAQLLREPVRVEAPPPPEVVPRIAARAEIVAGDVKRRRLVEILEGPEVTSAIVFCRTRRGADALARDLAGAGLATGVIHSERPQEERTRTLTRFRTGAIVVLVATDLVARGIDVPGVSHVVNYDLPDDVESYVHRIGRTGRAGARGHAITLCAPAELGRLRRIERMTKQPLLPRMCRNCRTELMSRRPPRVWPRPGCAGRATGAC